MAKTIDPQLAKRLRYESEQTREDDYPTSTRAQRPNRSKVYSVRLSADEQSQLESVARAIHIPPSTLVRAWILDRLETEKTAS